MALRIRLTRMGTKKRPFYRIVVMESEKARDGKYIDLVGNYDPMKEPSAVRIDNEKAVSWMQKGAIPSDTVKQLFRKQGIII